MLPPALSRASEIDSLKSLMLKVEGKDRIKVLNDIAYAYAPSSIEESLYYNKRAYDEAILLKDTTWQIFILIDISYAYRRSADYSHALSSLKKAYELATSTKNTSLLQDCLNQMASLYLMLKIYDKALDYYHQVLKLYQKENNASMIGRTLNNIGIIFYKLDDTENALKYFSESLEIRIEIGEENRTFVNYNNMALIYNSLNDHEKAIYHFKKAIEVGIKYERGNSLANAYNGLGIVYQKMGNPVLARQFINKSIEECERINDALLQSSNYFYLAKLYVDENNFIRAKDMLAISDSLESIAPDKQKSYNNHVLYSEIYALKKMYDSAFYHQKKASDLKSEVFNEKLSKNLAEIQLGLQAEKASVEIALKDEKIHQNRELNYFLFTIVLLSLALISLVYRNYKVTNRINQKLSESHQEIETQKNQLQKKNEELARAKIIIETQNERLRTINEELEDAVRKRTLELSRTNQELEKAVHDLDQFIYKTSHDLRGPIATMQGLVNLGIIETADEISLEYFKNLRKISNQLNDILTYLIKVHETYQSKPHLERIKIKDLIYDTIKKVRSNTLSSHIEVLMDFNGIEEWSCDKDLLTIIIESLTINAGLYAKNKNAFISVGTSYINGNLRLRIEDNGYGIQDNDLKKVFTMFFKGSPSPGGTGLEIYAAKVAVEKLGGKIVLEKPMDNTIFDIYLPGVN
jgi:signal transduction histidine kinase